MITLARENVQYLRKLYILHQNDSLCVYYNNISYYKLD